MRRVALALLVAAAALAGCVDDPAPEEDPDQPVVVTDPGDYTYVGNATLDNGGHLHDYWGGQDRLVVVDAEQEAQVGLFGIESVPANIFRPEAEHVVPQGTGEVLVTASWETDALSRYGDVELWVKTAAENDAVRVQVIESGDTVTIVTEHANNDLPHQVLSAWEFHVVVYLPDDGLTGRFWGNVQVHVEAVRGLDIPVYPAHQDQWGGRETIQVVDVDSEVLFQTQDGMTNSCSGGGCLYLPFTAIDGAVVPVDAARVRMVVEWQANAPSSLAVAYHAADAWDLVTPDPVEDEDGRRVYEIPVQGIMGDGPYTQQTLWEFWLWIDDPSNLYSGSYSLDVFAERV